MNRLRACKTACILLGGLLVSSCNRGASSARSETRIFEVDRSLLVHEIHLTSLRTARGEAARAELEAAHRRLYEAETDLELASLQKDQLQLEIDHLEASLAEAVAQHKVMIDRVRMKAAGMEIPHLKTLTGQQYEEVKVLSVADEGALIQHRSGVARLGTEDFGQAWSERLGLDATSQKEALARRDEAEAAYYRRVDLELAALKKSEALLAKANTSQISQPLSQPRDVQPFGFDRKVGLRSLGSPETSRRYSRNSYRRTYRRYYRPRVYVHYYKVPQCSSRSGSTLKFTPSTPCQ
jgi:hypothetical protein